MAIKTVITTSIEVTTEELNNIQKYKRLVIDLEQEDKLDLLSTQQKLDFKDELDETWRDLADALLEKLILGV